jgi:hypothetical protein
MQEFTISGAQLFFAAGPWAVDVMSITNCKIMVKIITGFSCLLAIWNWKHMTLIFIYYLLKMKDSQLKAYNSYIRRHACPIFIQAWIWLMWHMTILYASTNLSNKNVIVNKRCLWHVTAQKICSLITPAKMHCLYFITSISVAPAKILSAKKGRMMSGQSAEHSCEINIKTYYVFLRNIFHDSQLFWQSSWADTVSLMYVINHK